MFITVLTERNSSLASIAYFFSVITKTDIFSCSAATQGRPGPPHSGGF